jgi:hypothetical protein
MTTMPAAGPCEPGSQQIGDVLAERRLLAADQLVGLQEHLNLIDDHRRDRHRELRITGDRRGDLGFRRIRTGRRWTGGGLGRLMRHAGRLWAPAREGALAFRVPAPLGSV